MDEAVWPEVDHVILDMKLSWVLRGEKGYVELLQVHSDPLLVLVGIGLRDLPSCAGVEHVNGPTWLKHNL